MKAVNLIPSDQRAAAKPAAPGAPAGAPSSGGAMGAYLVLAVLAFAIAAAALYVLTGNDIKSNEAELAHVEQEATAVEAQAASLQTFADFKQMADSRVSTVRALATTRFEWERTLDDMSRALPSDVYISSFDGATGATSGGSGLRGAILAPSIELNGCTDDQASVARLMSSLREIRGVTRVTLSRSEAIDTADTAVAPAPATAADGSTPSVTTEPCPDGSPPSFNVIVFFERAPLTGAAAPNLAVAAVGPSGPTGPTGPTGSTGATTPASSTTTTTP